MIDLERLRILQKNGAQELHNLPEQELDLLIGYCSLIAQDVQKTVQQTGISAKSGLVNAVFLGIGLGMKMSLRDNEVKEREQ